MSSCARRVALLLAVALGVATLRAEDGYRLWLRYERIDDAVLRERYATVLARIALVTPAGRESETLVAARTELVRGLGAMLGMEPEIVMRAQPAPPDVGRDGFAIRRVGDSVELAAARDVGVLYAAFALLRDLQLRRSVATIARTERPRIRLRMLNHWDNLDGSVERGYAGRSLWNWEALPGALDSRYRDYARANASLGINATVLTNVNANAQVLTAAYLRKVAALAEVFRPYGIQVFLTARFSAPVEIGGLATADPLEPAVRDWWRDKVAEIYRVIPDFGGFLVKANSEGQPGPQNYGRNHADGANMLAAALAPHGGIVIWRAFVYDSGVPEDRHKQAFNEFQPLDGRFHDNVVIQVKNGPIDFMPREPFHPLFGAMPRTPLALELQITQEYLGGSTQLAFLAPMWRETLEAETFRPARGATVARVVDGTVDGRELSVMAGVANTGSDRTWSGNHLAPANWYAFGRLAWDHTLSAAQIADEWTQLTFGHSAELVRTLTDMLLASHEAVVSYSMPLGLHHIMARDHHQGPGPWVSGGRADWTSVYYHRADEHGVGFDRTPTGSNALAQYAPEVARRWGDPATCPENLLLWFHRLGWERRMASGRTLWDELGTRYQAGVDEVRRWQRSWSERADEVDAERFPAIATLLARQERESRIWRDACLLYFQTFARRPLPAGVEPPTHSLEYYQSLRQPFSARLP